MPIDLQTILSREGAVARRLERFETRPEQMEMAAAVEQALADRGRLLVEAGTGVGKSFAYLIPAIKRIVESEERVVVATNTINLQEQLIEKDIPLLNAAMPEEFSAVLVKGRGNYLSLRRLKLASERQDRLFGDDDARHALHVIEDWAYGTSDGTLATLPRLRRQEVWDHARSDAHNCMGRKCPSYDTCFYQAARRRMENGDLLVCNHALFFSDLALRTQGVGFLPPYDHVILDEGHCVEEVAAEHFGVSLGEARVAHLLRMLYHPQRRTGFLASVVPKEEGAHALIDEAIEQTYRCTSDAEAFFDALVQWQGAHGRSNGRIPGADIVPNPLSAGMKRLSEMLRLLKEQVRNEADQYELNSYATRAAEIAASAETLLGQRIDGCVYFTEGMDTPTGRSSRGRRRRVSLRCMAVDVAPILREQLFGREVSVILTSATLATGGADGSGDFSHVTSRLGCENAVTRRLGSPFDHARQMRVVVDQRMPAPNDPRYVRHLVPRIERLVRETEGGAFVLFTSFAMLDEAAGLLRPGLAEAGLPLLVHGADGPPGLLVKRFQQDRRSVLLGTVSFWQGVDVRGEGLRNVIITRLPFEVPDRPLVEARHERLLEQGGNPFRDDQLPRAVIRFRQGVGRLIRSQDDRGLVAVLDPRIVTKSYGRLFRDALPEGVLIEPIDDPELFEDPV